MCLLTWLGANRDARYDCSVAGRMDYQNNSSVLSGQTHVVTMYCVGALETAYQTV